jgi:hypothetical protein
MKELLEKIQKVSEKLRSIEKDMTVGKGGSAYKAVSDLSVILKVKEAEIAHRIISIPIKQELLSHEIVRTIKKGQNEDSSFESIVYVDLIKMTVKIFDLDSDQSIEIESLGRGWDASDKGLGKASTYARKYALLNAYKIATGEDPDSEPSEKQTAITKDDKKIAVMNFLNENVEYANSILTHFGVSQLSSLTDNNIVQLYDTISKKKKI